MVRVIQISQTGGTEVMKLKHMELDKNGPKKECVRIKQKSIGVNYIDTYHRSGIYPVSLPCVLGLEAAGDVSAVGEGVEDFKVGDRVAYAAGPIGAYAEERDYDSKNLVKIPEYINYDEAAAILLKGMTVEYLFNRTYKIKRGEFFLFHAAAGGVGLVACQWAKAIGARMIGTVGNEMKGALAKKTGCEFIINYSKENVSKTVEEITGGKGVNVVYDGVGKDTFQTTIDCLADRGLFVSFGQSSGMIKDVSLHASFAPKNLYYTRPSLLVYNKTKKALSNSSAVLFNMIKENNIKVENIKKYNLEDAAKCHEDLQLRKTHGSLILKA